MSIKIGVLECGVYVDFLARKAAQSEGQRRRPGQDCNSWNFSRKV